jgi:hypothetical protein
MRCAADPLTTYPARGEGRNLCAIPVTLELGTTPARVSWDESRAGDDLTTSLTVYRIGPTGREERLYFASATLTLNVGGDLLSGIFSFFPTADGPAHIGYTVAHCGANCGPTDVVVGPCSSQRPGNR